MIRFHFELTDAEMSSMLKQDYEKNEQVVVINDIKNKLSEKQTY